MKKAFTLKIIVPFYFTIPTQNKAFSSVLVLKTNNTMKWEDGNEYPVFMCDTSSASHPFYTGKTRQIGNEGRASEFASRYGKFGAFKSK